MRKETSCGKAVKTNAKGRRAGSNSLLEMIGWTAPSATMTESWRAAKRTTEKLKDGETEGEADTKRTRFDYSGEAWRVLRTIGIVG